MLRPPAAAAGGGPGMSHGMARRNSHHVLIRSSDCLFTSSEYLDKLFLRTSHWKGVFSLKQEQFVLQVPSHRSNMRLNIHAWLAWHGGLGLGFRVGACQRPVTQAR
jgi:hypothetical protein